MEDSEIFGPSEAIRNFDATTAIGKVVTVKYQAVALNDPNSHIEIQPISIWPEVFDRHGSMYTKHMLVADDIEGTLDFEIKDAYLMQAKNGGRRDFGKYKSYADYYNKKRRDLLDARRSGGMIAAITMGPGDDHGCDLVLDFGEFQIENRVWRFTPPEEWYSELFRDRTAFRFVDGFYENAAIAIAAFSQKNTDDMFGERYFPLAVFPRSPEGLAGIQVVENIPKACSDIIATDEHLIVGTRCKPYEYEDLIDRTYEEGGQVPIGLQFDW